MATPFSESKTTNVESVPQTTTQILPIGLPLSTGLNNNSLSNRSSSTPKTPPPYHPDFQPRGVTRSQTDKFLVLRRVKLEGQGEDGIKSGLKRVERTKLERRLEKLIHLHFPAERRDDTEVERRRSGVGVAGGGDNRRTSSFFDFDIRNMSIPDAGVLLRGVLGAGEMNGDVRAAEQRITPWQDDTSVSKCPICATAFHPLTTRKHHCRLCGQIICSLPPKRPQRQDTCSLLFVVDSKTRIIEQVGEGVDYGVRRRGGWNADGRTPPMGSYKNVAEEEKFLKGVRICRSCRPVLLRQQHLQEVTHVPTLMKLHDMFLRLELEIEESLPQFQELILTLSQEDQPTKDASATRKRLLQAFAQYDELAKRIRQLPSNGPGSSQDRVQMAVMARASLFLQKNMFPLQSLPTKRGTEAPTLNTNTKDTNTNHFIDPSSQLALALQPLLEQEALLESFVEEAEARRKFEDVKTLKANLREIRAEIQKIIVNSEDDIQGGADGSG
ncbi:FYVE zinc finger-domain-containing protein [Collybia nuda]|uniref:FYVE zinc finger-domain-containing protein n=1 Tax=Collybia nuda TaxID=64659 RepID=A0A9P5XWZ8_9AGAR|nr:FYVE zinc finger-domain-containing protein [Collybia nuda]